MAPAEAEGRFIFELDNGQWNIPMLRELLEDILPNHSILMGFEVTHDFASIGQRAMMLNARRLDNEPGLPERIVLVIEDITERKLADERQQTMTNELNHRVKNTLAVVQSIASQTARSTSDPKLFVEAFSGRVAGLARVHEILARGAWSGADLKDVVQTNLWPFLSSDGTRLTVEGNNFQVDPTVAVACSMALYELATNAAKYGALSPHGGSVHVQWQVRRNGKTELILQWTERDGPKVVKPARNGFGTKLINAVSEQLGAQIALDYDPKGVRCRFAVPIVDRSHRSSPPRSGG